MKKNNPVFGVLFAVVVAAIFLAVSFPKGKTASLATVPTPTLNKYY
jgi:hypothetical protein